MRIRISRRVLPLFMLLVVGAGSAFAATGSSTATVAVATNSALGTKILVNSTGLRSTTT